jgi:hypothetical protein
MDDNQLRNLVREEVIALFNSCIIQSTVHVQVPGQVAVQVPVADEPEEDRAEVLRQRARARYYRLKGIPVPDAKKTTGRPCKKNVDEDK